MSRQSALPEIIIASLNIGERRADYTPTTLSTRYTGKGVRRRSERIYAKTENTYKEVSSFYVYIIRTNCFLGLVALITI